MQLYQVKLGSFEIYKDISWCYVSSCILLYRGAYKSLARPTSQCISFDDENISSDVSLVIYRVSQEEWTKLRESVPYVKL